MSDPTDTPAAEPVPGTDVKITWTDADIATVKRLTEEPARRRQLFDDASAGLKEATGRLDIQRDALAELAAKLAAPEAVEFTPDEVALLADAVGGWLLKFAVGDLVDQVTRDRLIGPNGINASHRTLGMSLGGHAIVGHGGIY